MLKTLFILTLFLKLGPVTFAQNASRFDQTFKSASRSENDSRLDLLYTKLESGVIGLSEAGVTKYIKRAKTKLWERVLPKETQAIKNAQVEYKTIESYGKELKKAKAILVTTANAREKEELLAELENVSASEAESIRQDPEIFKKVPRDIQDMNIAYAKNVNALKAAKRSQRAAEMELSNAQDELIWAKNEYKNAGGFSSEAKMVQEELGRLKWIRYVERGVVLVLIVDVASRMVVITLGKHPDQFTTISLAKVTYEMIEDKINQSEP